MAMAAGCHCLRSARAARIARPMKPQIHITRKKPRGQVIQNGAWSEKLPSENRKDAELARKIEPVTTAPRTAYGSRRRQSGRASQKSGRKMMADSFEISARIKSAS